MRSAKYRESLRKRMEKTFAAWEEQGSITESDLYSFIHSLKGMAHKLGMDGLEDFCNSQLNNLSADATSKMPVASLKKFRERILLIVERHKDFVSYDFSSLPTKRFEEEMFVLVIDDDVGFVSYVKELLEKLGAQVLIAMNGKKGIEQFYSMRPNFVFVDLDLPDMSGFDILDQIGETARAKRVPIFVFSSDYSKDNQIIAYEKGAMDFIEKPLELDTFVPFLFNRELYRKSIDQSIITDGLTGVGNRKYFEDTIQEYSSYFEKTGVKQSLVMLDLDHFKKVNDRYGHIAGDEVLRKFGEVALEEKRHSDKIFRYGGEEFAIVLSNTNAEEAVIFIEKLRSRFSQIVFCEENTSFSVTFSAGVTEIDGTIDQMIINADQALYEAKRTGRNRTVIYNERTAIVKRELQVIIVDDDHFFRTMLQDTLKSWTTADFDVSVLTFEDGPAFLNSDWYKPNINFIVLLDGIMPQMDGLEVLGRLKQICDENNVIVSMMTARTGETDVKTALWLGADDYIMKPFQPEEVLVKIQNLSTRMFT